MQVDAVVGNNDLLRSILNFALGWPDILTLSTISHAWNSVLDQHVHPATYREAYLAGMAAQRAETMMERRERRGRPRPNVPDVPDRYRYP